MTNPRIGDGVFTYRGFGVLRAINNYGKFARYRVELPNGGIVNVGRVQPATERVSQDDFAETVREIARRD